MLLTSIFSISLNISYPFKNKLWFSSHVSSSSAECSTGQTLGKKANKKECYLFSIQNTQLKINMSFFVMYMGIYIINMNYAVTQFTYYDVCEACSGARGLKGLTLSQTSPGFYVSAVQVF